MNEFKITTDEHIPPLASCLYHLETKPENESFLDMLRFTFVPYFQLYTFTFFWLATCCFVYVYSLYRQQNVESSIDIKFEFLRVSQGILFELGENYPYYIVSKFHYYRMLTSLVLFRNFYHFLIGCIGIAVFGSYVEELVGFKRIFLMAITCGVGAELIRDVFVHRASIESLTPICGLFGYLMGLFLANSQAKWCFHQSQKLHMLFVMFTVILFYFQLSYYYRNISLFSMTTAIIIGFVFYFCDPAEKYSKWRVPSIVILCTSIGLSVFVLFFNTKPVIMSL